MLVKIVKGIYTIIDKMGRIITSLSLALIVIVTFGNVILRYIFSAPLPWVEEMSTLFYTFMVFFGLGITHKEGSAVGVDIVITMLPMKLKKIFDGFATVVTMLLWVALCYLGVLLALKTKSTCTPYLRIPYHYIYWFFPTAGFFCIVQLIYHLTMIVVGKVEYMDAKPNEAKKGKNSDSNKMEVC